MLCVCQSHLHFYFSPNISLYTLSLNMENLNIHLCILCIREACYKNYHRRRHHHHHHHNNQLTRYDNKTVIIIIIITTN